MDLEHPIRIVGAGMSGLVAALQFQKHGFPFIIHEQSSQPGGRLYSEVEDGWAYDKGFQVLLTDYPMTKNYLDYEALNLQYFKAGAQVFKNGEAHKIGNPLQELSLAWPTIRYPWASFSDKWKLAQLTRELLSADLPTIFSRPEYTTIDYLKTKGFSPGIIDSFFRPFFGGIFLEKELNTSSRMFEFVLKMFSSGYAAIPAEGIQMMAEQLAENIPKENFRWGQQVVDMGADHIQLKDGEQLKAAAVLSANSTTSHKVQKWNRCVNIYFSTEEAPCINDPMIGLIADHSSPVTNFHYLHELPQGNPNKESILSVTLVGKEEDLSVDQAIKLAEDTLATHAELHSLKVKKVFEIKRALPVLPSVNLEAEEENLRSESGVYYCGDVLSAPSLNMAMRNGEKAARFIMKALEAKP